MAGGRYCVYFVITFIVPALSLKTKDKNDIINNNSVLTVNDTVPTLKSLEDMVKRNNEINGELVSGMGELVSDMGEILSEMRKEFQSLRRELKLERTRREEFEGKMEKCIAGVKEIEPVESKTSLTSISTANTTMSTTATSTSMPMPTSTTTIMTSTSALVTATNTTMPTTSMEASYSVGVSAFEEHYMLVMRRLNWREAKEACQDHGAYLVSVNTQAENDYLVKQIKIYNKGYYWMGMTLAGEKEVWLDGTDVNYTQWAKNEPNCMATHGCKAFFSEYFNFQWEDATQNDKMFYICELEKTEP